MSTPQINSSLVYSTVADLMPQEGKDFKLETEYSPENKPRLVITPLSPIGRAWVPFLNERLKKPMAQNGFDVVEGGSLAAEVVTINTIRKRVEEEAAEALKAKIRTAEADATAKRDAAAATRNAQIKEEGEKSRPNRAVVDASNAANTAMREKHRLTYIMSRMVDIRKELDRAAESAAKEDAARGRVWAVDMNAALTSLFDRQDVTQKLRRKEEIILQMAEQDYAIGELRKMGVEVAKQYIIQKEG